MKTWTVFFKIVGHVSIEVEAVSEDDAVNRAAEMVSMENIEDWDIVRSSGEAKEA